MKNSNTDLDYWPEEENDISWYEEYPLSAKGDFNIEPPSDCPF